MDNSFRSTVLPRAQGDGKGEARGEGDMDRHGRGHDRHQHHAAARDVMNAHAGSAALRHLDSSSTTASAASFSLRSPTVPTGSAHAHAHAHTSASANANASSASASASASMSASTFHAPPPFASPGRNTNASITTSASGHHHHHQHNHGAAASPPLQSPPRLSPPLHHSSVAHHHAIGTGHRHHGHGSAPAAAGRVASSSPYMASSSSSPAGAAGPPPLPPPSTSSNPPTSSSRDHHHQHGAPPVSPRHPPASSASNYYPPPASSPDSHHQSLHHTRDKPASGRVYDPTTDTTKERRVSDSWHNAPQNSTPKTARDPYPYERTPADQHHSSSYYSNNNGHYTSPRPSYNRPRSPLSHSHPSLPVGSHSPPGRTAQLPSPSERHVPAATLNSTTNGSSAMSTIIKSEPRAVSPSKPVSASSTNTPGRSADPMSFSNILSSAEPAPKPAPEPRGPSPEPLEPEQDGDTEVEPERDVEHEPEPEPTRARKAESVVRKKPGRRPTKGRASDIRDAEAPKGKRRSSMKRESPQPRSTSKRLANGQPKATKTWSSEMEKKISNSEIQIENDVPSLDPTEFDEQEYKQRAQKRRRIMIDFDADQGRLRRDEYTKSAAKKLLLHSELGKRRYDDVFYDQALHEVREQELFAEKERKKDMQRKRRREKSMAVTIELKEAALARANAAADENERQKHLRDAERASKKAQQTKLILQKGIKGPARNLELNLEGGTMSSFLASDADTPKKGRGKGGRLKKSKEQKKAEKDSAEAAQALLDAGKELPPKEESKVRIKIKGRSNKEKEKEKDTEKTKESKEPVKEKKDEVSELEKKFSSKGYNQIYEQIWRDMARKDVNKTFKMAVDSYATKGSNLKKTAILASKEAKRWQLRTNKGTKDLQARAKRVMRDMMGFWKRNEREERDLRKAAEKQEIENARREEADREAARQKRKLNFLISQTELYSHFIGKKIKTDEVERSTDNPDIAQPSDGIPQKKLDIAEPSGPVGDRVTDFENLDFDNEDETQLQAAAMANAQNAIAEAQKKARAFNNEGDLDMDEEGEMNFQNPTGLGEMEVEQPKLINAQLKEYQLKGLNWLVNLYEQGINGILADEMGLGKTVQSISVMAYLAEKHDIWGPFLVVAPASTLHNWQQEIAKFVPEFKILPYWGSAPDRKVLRKFWDRKHSTYRKDAAFHVCVTSYQLVVSDVAYFQKMRWQYMILDEAQAIKSSQSSRWKSLLGFHCRNRLLLTGTPIQNNMQELWALLHFIMPSLFDSHDEFSEWFSKDIESHAQSNTKLNEDQLKRLHMILKPFMLRRVKKHVQKELGDKIELDVFCNLTYRQRAYYTNLRNQINIMDLVEKATMGDDQDSGTLMNLVMQFRKVCNHPDLFERAEVTAPYSFGYFAETASFVREGSTVVAGYSTRSLINFELPSLVWTEGGRLNKASRDNAKAGWRNKALNHMMNIWSPDHVRENAQESKAFSWLRFADVSAGDVYRAAHDSLFTRAVNELQKSDRIGQMSIVYDEEGEDKTFTPAHALFNICARENHRPLAEITTEGILDNLMNVARGSYNDSGLSRLEIAGRSRASAPPVEVSCNSMSAVRERQDMMFNPAIRRALYGPNFAEEKSLVEQKVPLELYPSRSLLPKPDSERKRFTEFVVPSMRKFVTDSGKLAKLDELLFKLKNEGHRVLLYFQMTRMIDMMEEYLTYRNYKYCRLDGSTKLEDRRDTVHDFQTRPEIFIFLLSTRAGGLGINLTSADTVIFYDSDWNPTIDSQAMDRAHRLGQTKQVTVYRLITRGTIEERIRKRALQKEEVQRVVIQGGGASVDFSGRRAPENRNRDIAMWLADDEQAEMIERREKELLESGEYDKQKRRGGKRKKAEAPASLDDMYHEGEGHFDDGSRAGASGTATPAESDTKGKRGRGKAAGKRAKTAKQRLAIADGMVDA